MFYFTNFDLLLCDKIGLSLGLFQHYPNRISYYAINLVIWVLLSKRIEILIVMLNIRSELHGLNGGAQREVHTV